ncbi:hypothetical protein ACG1BZ_22620 [Microbulbifer sp. CNSA002]|uniref:hypothetical protein n=1 Tax=Microbulbifer sp. CNSA002 TaxID=3373604 RepID=UPI0039B6D621
MIYPKLFHKLFPLVVFLCISACSGGSSSNKKDTIDDDPEITMNLTIQGYVEVGDYTGVEVVFQIEDEVFNADLDMYGNYTVELEVSELETDSFVQAEAIFPAGSGMKLVSALGSFESLLEKSGDDAILVRSELLSVNITSVTTALSALLEVENNGTLISESQYETAYQQLNPYTVFDVAAYINLLINNPQEDRFAVPDEFDDVYEFATNFSLMALYISQIKENFLEEFESTKISISKNQNLVSASPSILSSIEDTYYLLGDNLKLTLRADGTGEMIGAMDSAMITWAQSDDGLVLEGADLVTSYYYHEYDLAFVETHIRVTKLNWVSNAASVDSVILNSVQYEHYPGGEYQGSYFIEKTLMSLALRSSAELAVSNVIELGKTYSLPIASTVSDIVDSDKELSPVNAVMVLDMSFHGDYENGGRVDIIVPELYIDGTSFETELSGVWFVNDHNQLTVEVTNKKTLTYTFFDYNSDDYNRVFVVDESYEIKLTKFSSLFGQELEGWEGQEVPGMYYIPNLSRPFFTVLEHYWVELNADGSVSTVRGLDLNLDGQFDESEINLTPGLWRLEENGELTIRHYSQGSESCIPGLWDPDTISECQLAREYKWDLYRVDGENRFYMKKTLKHFSDISSINGQLSVENAYIYNSKMEKISERPFEVPGI